MMFITANVEPLKSQTFRQFFIIFSPQMFSEVLAISDTNASISGLNFIDLDLDGIDVLELWAWRLWIFFHDMKSLPVFVLKFTLLFFLKVFDSSISYQSLCFLCSYIFFKNDFFCTAIVFQLLVTGWLHFFTFFSLCFSFNARNSPGFNFAQNTFVTTKTDRRVAGSPAGSWSGRSHWRYHLERTLWGQRARVPWRQGERQVVGTLVHLSVLEFVDEFWLTVVVTIVSTSPPFPVFEITTTNVYTIPILKALSCLFFPICLFIGASFVSFQQLGGVDDKPRCIPGPMRRLHPALWSRALYQKTEKNQYIKISTIGRGWHKLIQITYFTSKTALKHPWFPFTFRAFFFIRPRNRGTTIGSIWRPHPMEPIGKPSPGEIRSPKRTGWIFGT